MSYAETEIVERMEIGSSAYLLFNLGVRIKLIKRKKSIKSNTTDFKIFIFFKFRFKNLKPNNYLISKYKKPLIR